MATTLDKKFYNFKADEKGDTLQIGAFKFNIATYHIENSPGNAIFVKNKTFNLWVNLDDLYRRLGKSKASKTIRQADYKIAGQDGGIPFATYSHYGQQCWMPSRMEDMLSGGDTFVDKDVLKDWESFAMNLAGPSDTIGTSFAYGRFKLAPPEKSPVRYEVFFTPLINKPVFRVTKKLLEDVINENQKDDDGIYDNWKLTAITATQAKKEKLKLVGTNFFHLYQTWMREEDYRALWKAYKPKATQLPIPFPTKNAKTIKAFADLDKDLKEGTRDVDGVEIRLTTQRMQTTAGKRSAAGGGAGKSGFGIMGKSATKFVKLWGSKPPSTAEWLHRSAFSYGGIDVDFDMRSSDDPNNVIFGSTESNTDMIRAELMVKKLMAQYDDHKFEGFLTTTCTRKGNVTRRDFAKTNPQEDVPTFLPDYPWLSFDLKYEFRMPRDSSPFGSALNAKTHFEPWSIYTPLAIEPRMDAWVVNHLRTLYLPSKKSKVAKAFPDSGFLEALSSSETVNGSDSDIAAMAWEAAQAGLPELSLPGLLVMNPSVLAPEPTSSATLDGIDSFTRPKAFALPLEIENSLPPQGFTVQGNVAVFGTPIVGQLQKWVGPPPEDVVVGADPPICERVSLPGDIHLSSLLPELKDTPYDVITFREVAFWHQNYQFDKTREIGWHFDAKWVIDPSCGVLHDALRSVLGVDTPVLNIQAALGWDQQWDAPLDLHSFTLEGVFTGLTLSPMDGLRLTSVGVRLLGIRGFELNPEPHSTLSYGFGIFGTMTIDVPGALLPLELAYNMGVVSGYVNISAELTGEIWKNALGIEKLTLEDVSFVTSFSLSSPWKSLSFSISATFWYLASQAFFSGTFAPGSGHFELAAEFDDFSIAELDCLFYTLFGDSLSLPDYEVHIGSAVLSIASGTGLSVALHDVNIAGHTALDVGVSLSTSGVHFSGALSSNKISFGHISILEASLDISFWAEKEGKKVDVQLKGTLDVEFIQSTVFAAVHLYPGDHGVEWTIVALLSAQDKAISISDIVPNIDKGSDFDLSLKNAMVVAASKDDPMAMIDKLPPGCTVRQGIQVAAVIESLPVLATLLRVKDVSGLVLSAGWSKDLGFDLKIILPAATTINFGSGIHSTPISLELRTKPLELAVATGITIPVKNSTALTFDFILKAGLKEAGATVDMKNEWWDQPFGVENLKLGPGLGLTIGIEYQLFIETGTPTYFGVKAGIKIGAHDGHLVMMVSENPKDELISGHLNNIDISDLITFGAKMVGADIPQIHDLLKFEKLDIYICPYGVNFGQTPYPAGFSFKANMIFFGHKADIECKIDKAQKLISLNGGVDNFTLGPLTVRGTNGQDRAVLKCELGISKQELLIDGLVDLFGAEELMLYVKLKFMDGSDSLPDPSFKFNTFLKFAGILTYELKAELLGSLKSLQSLKDADFALTSTFETYGLGGVAEMVIGLLDTGNTADVYGLEAAQLKLEEAAEKWKAFSHNADLELRDAHEKWREHEISVREANQHIVDAWMHKLERLTAEAARARAAFHDAQSSHEAMVEEATRKAAEAATHLAQITKENQQIQHDLTVVQKGYEQAAADLLAADKAIEDDILSAEYKLAALKLVEKRWSSELDDAVNAPAWKFWKKNEIPDLYRTLSNTRHHMATINKQLDTAHAAHEQPYYLDKKDKERRAKAQMEAAEKAAKEHLEAGLGPHELRKLETQAALDLAKSRLTQVQTGEEYLLWQDATQALDTHSLTKSTVHDPARSAIDGLMTSVQYRTYTSALGAVALGLNSWISPEHTHGIMQLANGESGVFSGIAKAIDAFGLKGLGKPVNIKSITLSGTLRGALGLGGKHSQPLSASVSGSVLGVPFSEKVVFDPADPISLARGLLAAVWHLLTSAATTLGGLVQPVTVNTELPAPMLPIPTSHGYAVADVGDHASNTFLNEVLGVHSLLPGPPPSQPDYVFASSSRADTRVMYIAPLLPVHEEAQFLSLSAARARFLGYQFEGTIDDAEKAKQLGLVAIPVGLFTANPPLDLLERTAQ